MRIASSLIQLQRMHTLVRCALYAEESAPRVA